MRTIQWITILLMLGTFAQADNDIYGADGSYKGYVSGNIYGADGSYKGEVDD